MSSGGEGVVERWLLRIAHECLEDDVGQAPLEDSDGLGLGIAGGSFNLHSRRIVGWRAATSLRTDLALDALEQAIWSRRREGANLAGLVHHCDRGVHVSFAFTQRLVEKGVDPPVGSVGDAYDNALAESQIGLYKAELIRPEGPWRGVEHVELETLNYVHWFNHDRLHEAFDDLTPTAAEELHYAAQNELRPTG